MPATSRTLKAPRKTSTVDPTTVTGKSIRGRPRSSGSEPLGIGAVDIALDIITHMVARKDSLSLSDLSRATSLQPSKLHRYLVSLTRSGFLRQSPVTGQYDFGPFARRVGAAAFNRHHGLGVVQEAVAKIADQSGCTTYLYIWTELGPTVIRMELGRNSTLLTLREGTALPVCGSATGRVFLAHLPASQTKELVRAERAIAARQSLRIWTDAELQSECDKIRAAKVYWTKEAIIPGLLAAVPILDSNGELNSIITLLPKTAEDGDREAQRVEKILESHADRLARELP
jgi:DNA-binding IclR family transcriptional regulator